MSKKNIPLAAYLEQQRVMEAAALSEDGVRFRLPTFGKAVSFRQKCYAYRNKIRELAAAEMGDVPGMEPSTKYDTLYAYIEDAEGHRIHRSPERDGYPVTSHYDVVVAHVDTQNPGELLSFTGEPLPEDGLDPDLGLEVDPDA